MTKKKQIEKLSEKISKKVLELADKGLTLKKLERIKKTRNSS
jgi:hypothetical protein